MSEQRDEFDFLGRDARTGGALPAPFDGDATASDVAIAIHAALVDVGLTPQAIRKVGCALLGVSLGTEHRCDASHARHTRGEK